MQPEPVPSPEDAEEANKIIGGLSMNWIDYEYPNTAYIVEVKYSGDIGITTCRCKDMPKTRDNSRGFTQGFWDYEQAVKYARHVAAELTIPAAI